MAGHLMGEDDAEAKLQKLTQHQKAIAASVVMFVWPSDAKAPGETKAMTRIRDEYS